MVRLENLRIVTRLALGFGALIGCVILLAVVAWLGVQRQSDAAQQLVQHDVRYAEAVALAHNRVVALRRFEKEIVLGATQSTQARIARRQWGQNSTQLQEQLEIASPRATPEELRSIEEVKSALTHYQQGIETTYLGVLAGQFKTPQEASSGLDAYKDDVEKTERLMNELFTASIKRIGGIVPALEAVESRLTAVLVATVVASLIIGVLLALFLTRSITRQLGGEPRYAAEVAKRVASGDLSVEVRVGADDQSSLLYALKQMRDDLAAAVAAIQSAAQGVRIGSSEISRGNQELSSRTEQQASSLEETASSMEELTSTVKQNTENARQASQFASGASDVAARGGEAVQRVVSTMSRISESASKVADIISVIDGIAFQTNILALNAAVEAARAGEQGRGFAVVASEVRALAQRSAGAAKEIKTLIENSLGQVRDGARLADGAGGTMQEIVTSIKRVTDIMSEIAAASQEQLSGIEQVGNAITQMDRVVQQNAALVEESASAAENLSGQAESLALSVERFRLAGKQDDANGPGDGPPAADSLQPPQRHAALQDLT